MTRRLKILKNHVQASGHFSSLAAGVVQWREGGPTSSISVWKDETSWLVVGKHKLCCQSSGEKKLGGAVGLSEDDSSVEGGR